MTETFYDRAIERAQYLDSHLARTGKVVGPLHGLPISLKVIARRFQDLLALTLSQDCFNVEGVPSTIGYVSFVDNGLSRENSALVSLLLELGAVLYVKTNLPQTIMVGKAVEL